MNEKINKKLKEMEDSLYHIRIVNYFYNHDSNQIHLDLEFRFLDGPLKGEYAESTIVIGHLEEFIEK